MTTLVVHELDTYASQSFTVDNGRRLLIESVRPYLFFYNAPAGSFTLSLYAGATLLDSADITFADIQTALETTDNFVVAYCRFEFENQPVLNPGTYELKLTASGYTKSATSYAGWVALHEDLINDITYTPVDDSENPLTFQLWGYRWSGY